MKKAAFQRCFGVGVGLALLPGLVGSVSAQNAEGSVAERAPAEPVRGENMEDLRDERAAAGAIATQTDSDPVWSFAAAAYSYFVPDGPDYVQPTLSIDRDAFHFEARYNYEDQETGSTWLGWNLAGGDGWRWELTPMLGGVFGNTSGVAPGYNGAVGWWKLELYSEGEWVLDVADPEESFFYTWSELTIAPADWLRFGLVTQRTRAYRAERDVQRGLLVGISVDRIGFMTCVFNPDDNDPLVVMAVTISF